MKSRYYLEGLLGLLSVLGFVGVFTEERMFLAFFAFAYADMFLTGAVTLGGILWGLPAGRALLYGILWGWAAAVVVQSLSVAFCRFRESWGAS